MASSPSLTSRRRFLGGAVVLVCTPPTLGCGTTGCSSSDSSADAPTAQLGPWLIPDGTVLDAAHYALLCALVDALVPADDDFAGATGAHAAWYIDQLFGAFRHEPPRIFAGGPYSGRHGGLDGFSHFQALTRVEEIRWRTYLEGSQGLPEREFNGKVVGLADRYRQGLDDLDAAATKEFGAGFALLGFDDRRTVLSKADAAFVQMAYEHAVEGTYGDPVYGGNLEGKGWQSIGYEGDRQPIGFSAHQMMYPEEG
jgi:hypothetical protein